MRLKRSSATQTVLATGLLLQLQWEFRWRGRQGVGALTRQAMRVAPVTLPELQRSGIDPWQTASAVWRAKRRLPFTSTCLQTALATQRLLAHQGVQAAVRVGVRDTDGPAHAWVEVAELVLDDQGLSGRYLAFAKPGERANA